MRPHRPQPLRKSPHPLRAALRRPNPLDDEVLPRRLLSYSRLNLSAALLALGDPEQAKPHLRAGWAQAPLFDMQPYFADYLALLAALDGRLDAAARLAGYADAGNARVGEREPNEAAAIARAVHLACAALGDAAFDRLHAEGAALRVCDVEALAFGTGASA